MPTTAFIQDDKHRLSVLSGQSLGVSSLKSGEYFLITYPDHPFTDYPGAD